MKKLAMLVAVIMLVGIALTGCQSAAPSAAATTGASEVAATTAPAAPSKPQVLRMNLGSEPPQMNSMLTTDVVSMNVMRCINEGLVRLDAENNPQPGMATSWDISADRTTYTFHMRDGAKWSNGDPVTSKDFFFAFKKIIDPATTAQYSYVILPLIKGAQEFYDAEAKTPGSGNFDNVGVKCPDDKTIVFTLNYPADYFLGLCGFQVFGPVDEKFYTQVGGDKYGTDADKLVFNGPYTMTEWTHDDHIKLVKNPDYWNASTIKLDEIDMAMIKDSNTALNNFLAGDFDMVGFPGKQIKAVTDAGFPDLLYSDGSTWYLEFNNRAERDGKKNPTSNFHIRQALSAAVDRKGFIDTVLKNSSKPAQTFTCPDIVGKDPGTSFAAGVDPSLKVKDNDPTFAKSELDLGLKDLGMKAEELNLSIVTDDSDTAKEIGAYFQQCWQKNLGITVAVDSQPFKSRLAKMTAGDYSVASAGWGPDFNDPMTYLNMWITGGGNNTTGYSNPQYDQLVKDAYAQTDRAKLFDIYYQIEKIVLTDMPIAPIYNRYSDYTVVPSLKGVVRNAFQDIYLLGAYFDDSAK